ncbi:PP2C family serine/threonine-protein phosphatase [Actinocrispum wychmicini]|uniref:Protein phosphatase 2C-like protein n=1 Tax=Actinocrispum wychmicini TaxID=1213861 RepID=A0A4R2IUN9_9PSEU|nr:PP2C family serine/threonine-protein phosphatase [Actinocrispum wychmicini]TCO48019.1 protein phosphatase 2C-like protein [Actinocrispum wychmicini]
MTGVFKAARPGADWLVTAVSVIGPRHERGGQPNQDRCLVHRFGRDKYLLAVADGAGSRSRAELGAELAVRAARDAAERTVVNRESLVDWCVARDRFALECLARFDRLVSDEIAAIRRSDSSAARLRDSFATTLLAVVVAPPYLLYLSVGDCFMVVDHDKDGPRLVVTAPEREHAGGTVFLTSSNRDRELTRGLIVDSTIRGVAISSDGSAEGLLNSRQSADGQIHYFAPHEFGRYFDRFSDPVSGPHDLASRLASAEFAATSGDDKTIIFAAVARS